MVHSAMTSAAWFLLLFSVASAEDQPEQAAPRKADALDIIPEDVVAAIAIRDVADLTKRGDEFIAKTELHVPMRLSDAYRFVTAYLGLKGGLDENGAAALMLFRSEPRGDGLVLAVPVGDYRAMAANFSLDRDQLVEGKVIDRQVVEDVDAIPFGRYVAVRNDHLFMGGSKELVGLAATGRTLSATLPNIDRQALAEDDILLYGNAQSAKDDWIDAVADINTAIGELPEDEAEALREVAEAANELHYLAAGIRLDGGFGANVVLQFDGDKSRDILTRLQGGKSKTSLAGLPAGQVLAAHASSGDGDKSAALARALLHFLLHNFSIQTNEFVSVGHRTNVVGVFGEGWQRLNGSRAALYENDNPERDGLFSFVAVLDTDDAGQFVKDMTGLARFINASGLSPDDSDEAIDARTIKQLIAELGRNEYRVRQMATTKLGLIGKSALPALDQAMKSDDPEVRFRARSVWQQINASLAAEREELLNKDLLSRIKPNFVYYPQQETRAGLPVDIIRMKLQVDEVATATQLKNMLGPQWNKMRLAAVDSRVIVLLGSNTSLLDQAIANALSDKPGLEAGNPYATFRRRTENERTVEFHLSLARAQQLVARDADAINAVNESTSTTSFGLSIAPQRIRFDLFTPFEEAKLVIKRMGW